VSLLIGQQEVEQGASAATQLELATNIGQAHGIVFTAFDVAYGFMTLTAIRKI